jgi:succinate-semialdehyde dehydrogenase/glutarate-semialdehyde dehydrogenase
MAFKSVNPANGELIAEFPYWTPAQLESALHDTARAAPQWAVLKVEERCRLLANTARVLCRRTEELARLMSLEMGKLVKEARAEVEKCAWCC